MRAGGITALQCMAHKSEINRMFIEQLCAAAISASMLPSSSTSRSNRSRCYYGGLRADCDCDSQTKGAQILTGRLKEKMAFQTRAKGDCALVSCKIQRRAP